MGRDAPAIHGDDHPPWGPDPLTWLPSYVAATQTRMEWALVGGNTTDPGVAGVQTLVWNSGILASVGAGWALGDSNKRIEVGDTGRYLVACMGDFNNTLSSAKTIAIYEQPYGFTGGTWTLHAGMVNVPFRAGELQPFASGVASLINLATYNFAIFGDTEGGIEFAVIEDDTANLVAWGAHTALLLRLH